MAIQFFTEDIDYSLTPDQKKTIKKWIQAVVNENNQSIDEINYIFCSDEYLLRINIEHLNHDFYTDIITFGHSCQEEALLADIYISIDRVLDNSKSMNVSFEKELFRVLIHGVLHLIGFNDHSDQDKITMRQKEDACLSLLKI